MPAVCGFSLVESAVIGAAGRSSGFQVMRDQHHGYVYLSWKLKRFDTRLAYCGCHDVGLTCCRPSWHGLTPFLHPLSDVWLPYPAAY